MADVSVENVAENESRLWIEKKYAGVASKKQTSRFVLL